MESNNETGIKIDKINGLKHKMDELCRIADEVRTESKGEYGDRSVISEIFSVSRERFGQKADSEAMFVVFYALQPSALLGKRMSRGLRLELSKFFPDASPCSISIKARDLLFNYEHYSDFRTKANEIYNELRK